MVDAEAFDPEGARRDVKMKEHPMNKHFLVTAATIAVASIPPIAAWAQADIPLKEAKLIIEHNATAHDTGFQGFIDSDGWKELTVTGPNGDVLNFKGVGSLGRLGLTELFFETVEPENVDVPIPRMLAKLPAGQYRISGPAVGEGVPPGTQTSGVALLTHVIPAGPKLLAPAEGAKVPAGPLTVKWKPVTTTISGGPVNIISYQLIVEKNGPPDPNYIGKRGLSMYLPATVTQIGLPTGFLEAGSLYDWEVLAIEESGNQTLSSSSFTTQ